jgi:hypothetical protein
MRLTAEPVGETMIWATLEEVLASLKVTVA